MLASMVLTAEQHLKIALLYEKAAADQLSVPPQQRAAFARKAKWFRMKARISARKEAASGPHEPGADATGFSEVLVLNGHGTGADDPSPIHAEAHLFNGRANFDARLAETAEAAGDAAAKPHNRSIAARLKLARAVLG
jgi:hypothetical protein